MYLSYDLIATVYVSNHGDFIQRDPRKIRPLVLWLSGVRHSIITTFHRHTNVLRNPPKLFPHVRSEEVLGIKLFL